MTSTSEPDPDKAASPTVETDRQVASLVAACIEALDRGEIDPVARICAGAATLAPRVEEQLQDLAARGLMPAIGATPETLGPFRIIREIGSGGMGAVYLAEQTAPVRRQVALKVIKLGMDTREVLNRFQAERQALAMMNHPGIARVYEAGATPEGRPYFAMEYVKGVPISAYCDQHRLGIPQRIELFRQVCGAVQHAHTKGVIHRDLKPSNVLIAMQDGRPQPKIIDFGLAKAMDHRLVDASIHTRIGALMGTPEYMSPEQAGVDELDVDTRTDVYSLGVILFELLTGELPFDSARLRKGGGIQIQKILRETDAPRPSSRVSTAFGASAESANRRRAAPAELHSRLRGDLDWIVLKALEKDRTRRYETAQELAADLGRHLEFIPVLARPHSAGYRLRRFVRRYRAQCVAAAAVLLALLAGGVGTFLQYLRAEAKADEALARKAEFDQLSGVVLHERALAAIPALDPPWPAHITAIRGWLSDCDSLLAMQPGIGRTIRDLEARAHPGTTAPDGTKSTLDFELPSQRFLYDTLQGLVQKLTALATTERPAVERRLAWARQVDGLTNRHPNARVTWEAARAAIAAADGVAASEAYREQPIELLPQLGLVPIGMNPATKLWEFYDLRSAWDGVADPPTLPIPQHDAAGRIAVADGTGIVFVLLPGATFLMGAQRDDPDAANYDPLAERDEDLHRVALLPYFLARHELTQGQWLRLSDGEQPSNWRPGETNHGEQITFAHPVEQVDWNRCRALLVRHGMTLPTEARWEYGCRAGSTAPWYPGPAPELLADHANLADATAKAVTTMTCDPWSDGFAFVAPVGSLSANRFGLHDTHGNLWEWCLDDYGPLEDSLTPGDGANHSPRVASDKTARGGAYVTTAAFARSANRNRPAPDFRSTYMGCRAARALSLTR